MKQYEISIILGDRVVSVFNVENYTISELERYFRIDSYSETLAYVPADKYLIVIIETEKK